MSDSLFNNREHAGELLVRQLAGYAGCSDVIVLALPRGGVPVGYVVAQALQVPLDVFVVRKLGVPGYEEFAIGAIASGGVRVLRPDAVAMLGVQERIIDEIAWRESLELERREQLYRTGRPLPQLEGRTVIVVDDGLATGATMLAAVAALRGKKPARIVVAVPVGAPDTCNKVRAEVDELICLKTPDPFYAVSMWYQDFTQTTDDEVKTLLRQAGLSHPLSGEHAGGTGGPAIGHGKNNEHCNHVR